MKTPSEYLAFRPLLVSFVGAAGAAAAFYAFSSGLNRLLPSPFDDPWQAAVAGFFCAFAYFMHTFLANRAEKKVEAAEAQAFGRPHEPAATEPFPTVLDKTTSGSVRLDSVIAGGAVANSTTNNSAHAEWAVGDETPLSAQHFPIPLQTPRSVVGPALSDLFRLYSSQIELYQNQARGRASWSFFWALIAMTAGLGFVGVAGWHILTAKEWAAVAGGGVIATVGGTMSAFLAKTFLEIHKESLAQLASYFQQPVLNDHIVMAERLTNHLPEGTERNKAILSIVTSLLTRVAAQAPSAGRMPRKDRKGPAEKADAAPVA